MNRALACTFAVGLILLAAALLANVEAPIRPLAVPMLIASAILFGAVVWMIFVRAWRTKGWSIWHPGRYDERTPLE